MFPLIGQGQINVASSGDASFDEDISVAGHAIIGGDASFDEDISVTGNAVIGGNASFGDDISVVGHAIIDSYLRIKGTSILENRTAIGLSSSPSSHQMLKIECSDANNCDSSPYTTSRYGVYSVAKDAGSTGESAYGLYGQANGYSAYGVYGYANGGYSRIGVYGKSNGGGFSNTGVRGHVSGSGYTNYGVYGYASGGTNNWAGYFNGNVYTTGSYSSSDERFKKEIASLDNAGILIKVLQLQPRRYQFYNNEELAHRGLPELNAKDGEHFGLVAQELEQIFPELVMDVAHILEDENGEMGENSEAVTTKAINYQELTVVLLVAVQELQQKVEELEKTLNKN